MPLIFSNCIIIKNVYKILTYHHSNHYTYIQGCTSVKLQWESNMTYQNHKKWPVARVQWIMYPLSCNYSIFAHPRNGCSWTTSRQQLWNQIHITHSHMCKSVSISKLKNIWPQMLRCLWWPEDGVCIQVSHADTYPVISKLQFNAVELPDWIKSNLCL